MGASSADHSQTCHAFLQTYQLTPQGFRRFFPVTPPLRAWSEKVAPLQNKLHLFVPFDTFESYGSLEVLYPPFFFCLDKEMLSRRKNGAVFRELQLWKIMKSMLRAARELAQEYPYEHLTVAIGHILLDAKGQLKLLWRDSLYEQGILEGEETFLNSVGQLMMQLATMRLLREGNDIEEVFKGLTRFSLEFKGVVNRLLKDEISFEQCFAVIKENKLKTM